ncbi:MAG: NAD(+)/NADH kinase [Pseudonocardia sp.]|nr:NAD(+)/NADH kinase [Pseudonocardia sp.]
MDGVIAPHRTDLLGLVVHPWKDVAGSVERVLRWAGGHGVTVLARAGDRERIGAGAEYVDDAELVARADGVLSLGGDGTMLGALRLVAARPVPVLGVNHGNLGFLTETEPADLESTLGRLVEGDFSVESRGALRLDQDGPEGDGAEGDGPQVDGTALTAFNDMVLRTATRGGTTAVDLDVAGEHFGHYRADALVVSSPSGSTAYNYAAGGPVVSPSLHAVVVTPVAPMSGISRPVVLGPEETIVLTLPRDARPAVLEADGAEPREVAAGSAVRIDYVRDAARIVRLDPARHARRSRVKLSLLDLPLRPDQLLELIPADLRNARGLPGGMPGGESDQ